MYFSKQNNFFHGIMFHHFHDDKIHKKSQGSISKDDFYKIIKFIGKENILDSDEFLNRHKENNLKAKDVCFTFDDSLKSHYDIAIPVLEDLKIKCFFFSQSSYLDKGKTNNEDLLETYRYFRTNYFSNMEEFYDSFFKEIKTDLTNFFNSNKKNEDILKAKFPFYSKLDIKFRLVRDQFLAKRNYKQIMSDMFKKKDFKPEDYYENLFLSSKHILEMKNLGHLIGLHSHTHPTMIQNLSYEDQLYQYEKNLEVLSKILSCNKKDISYMSHPNGSYNENTLTILKNLGIKLGFKSIMKIEPEKKMKKINNSFLEIARQDHAEIKKLIR